MEQWRLGNFREVKFLYRYQLSVIVLTGAFLFGDTVGETLIDRAPHLPRRAARPGTSFVLLIPPGRAANLRGPDLPRGSRSFQGRRRPGRAMG
jgi:hypothetical protein